MLIRVIEESLAALPEYAQVPIAFWVESHLRVEPVDMGLGGLRLIEEPVTPYLKDYDALPGEGPLHWRESRDISNWGILSAFDGTQRVGGAAIAWKTECLNLLDGDHVAALWDLRVHPEHRGRGIGHRLFMAVVAWVKERHCRRLLVETQNINVRACRFYARQGCELRTIRQYAYGDTLDEVQLLWYKDL